MDWKDIKNGAKKFWHFLWHEDSILSWIVNIVLAFIIIKFLIYPGIGLVLGTDLPVVAVISESMEHNSAFDSWWNKSAVCESAIGIYVNYSSCTQADWYSMKGITKEQFLKFSFHNGFNKGDIIILKGVSFDRVNVGDVIVFQSKLDYPIIHRVVYKDDVIQTKGDHNAKQLTPRDTDGKLDERSITKDQLIGKAWLKIPWLGYVKIWFVDAAQCVFSGFKMCRFE
jgi:signal peptidase I